MFINYSPYPYVYLLGMPLYNEQNYAKIVTLQTRGNA